MHSIDEEECEVRVTNHLQITWKHHEVANRRETCTV